MFSFFKSKPTLPELIPANYVDIHSHLLPGIDDGAQNFDDSLSYINQMNAMGFEQLITSPHIFPGIWNNTKNGIIDLKNKTIVDLKNNNFNNHFDAAAEYMMNMEFVTLFQKEKLLTLKDNYVLVEMSYINPPIQLYEIIFDLQIAGYIPVLAHPERYSFYSNKLSEYEKLKKAGCRFQLNLLSTVGYYSLEVAKTADFLLDNDFVDFVGSDIHHQNHIDNFSNKLKIKNIDTLEKAIAANQFFRI